MSSVRHLSLSTVCAAVGVVTGNQSDIDIALLAYLTKHVVLGRHLIIFLLVGRDLDKIVYSFVNGPFSLDKRRSLSH